jgi:hypothetical protein
MTATMRTCTNRTTAELLLAVQRSRCTTGAQA